MNIVAIIAMLVSTHSTPVYTTHTMVITSSEAKAHAGKEWTCKAPRALENDATQTVKECEYR